MYYLIALIYHLFGECTPYPYETEETKGKCCICGEPLEEER